MDREKSQIFTIYPSISIQITLEGEAFIEIIESEGSGISAFSI